MRSDLQQVVEEKAPATHEIGTGEKSVERAALEGANTESILRRHDLNLANTDEAQDFWRILPPDAKARGKVVSMAA